MTVSAFVLFLWYGEIMASRRDVVTFLTAPARSGKSFNEVRKLVDETIPQESGMIYTNLPLHCDKIADYCYEKYKIEKEDTLERLHIIPREIEHQWKEAGRVEYDQHTGEKIGKYPTCGPWDYFAGKKMSGATIIIDEIHNFCGAIGTPKAIRDLWQTWLGELGHNQAVFRCLSQAPEKVADSIKNEAAAYYTIRNTGLDTDPYFKIEIYDWLELWCGLFGGEYNVYVFEQETKKVEGRKVKGKRKLHKMGQPYFSFYDSFNAPIAHDHAEDVKQFEHEYERQLKKGPVKGRIGISWWFFKKYFYELISRAGIAILLAILILSMVTGVLPKYMTAALLSVTQPKAHASEATKAAGQGRRSSPRSSIKPATAASNKKQPEDPKEREIQILRSKLKNVENEKSRLQEELENASALVLISEKTITLRGGYTYEVGEEIDTGPYKGKKFVKINWARRSAILDDGTILKLSF